MEASNKCSWGEASSWGGSWIHSHRSRFTFCLTSFDIFSRFTFCQTFIIIYISRFTPNGHYVNLRSFGDDFAREVSPHGKVLKRSFLSNEIPSTTTTTGLERTEPLEMFPSGQRQLMERWGRMSGEISSETSDWVLGSIIPSLSFGTTWSSSTQMPRSFTDSDLGSFIEGAFVLTK